MPGKAVEFMGKDGGRSLQGEGCQQKPSGLLDDPGRLGGGDPFAYRCEYRTEQMEVHLGMQHQAAIIQIIEQGVAVVGIGGIEGGRELLGKLKKHPFGKAGGCHEGEKFHQGADPWLAGGGLTEFSSDGVVGGGACDGDTHSGCLSSEINRQEQKGVPPFVSMAWQGEQHTFALLLPEFLVFLVGYIAENGSVHVVFSRNPS